jgi:hypothetical protein
MVLRQPIECTRLFGRFSPKKPFYVHLNEVPKSSVEF